MAVRIDLTLDCANATRLADFWKLALGYQDEPPPAPYATRQEWLQAVDPGEDPDDGAWLCDPDGIGPRLSLLRVPEPKVAKNRLHLDLRVAGTGTPRSDGPGSPARSTAWPPRAQPPCSGSPTTTSSWPTPRATSSASPDPPRQPTSSG